MDIDEELIRDMQSYLLAKTGIHYFGRIKSTPKDIMVSCPFHKKGQEKKPSFGIKRFSDENGYAGMCHCFSCGIKTDLPNMMREILGASYNELDVNSRFGFNSLMLQNMVEVKPKVQFAIPKKTTVVSESILKQFRVYHPYLAQRRISENTAKLYDIGYDAINQHITFPIRDINNRCIGIGRRSILKKEYFYPAQFTKPLYGIYELERPIRTLYVVEGPFNLWSLAEWKKKGVALLGTGTSYQYEQLKSIRSDYIILALDPDDAGRNGILKLGKYLQDCGRKNIYVADLPDGKDINDLTFEEFRFVEVLTFKEWQLKYKYF